MKNLDKYGNSDTRFMFDRIKSNADKSWSFMVLSLLKEYFPNADHYISGGQGKSYTNIVIGIRDINAKRGKPFFYLYPQYSRMNVWCPIKTLAKRLRIQINSEMHDESKCRDWLDQVRKSFERNGYEPEGSGFSPIDYEIASDDEPAEAIAEQTSVSSLNTILYGPPGTGKTYNTIIEALQIIDPDFLSANFNERTTLKQRFDELMTDGQVRLITFHQSFSYEDFVEGLRAITNEDKSIEYVIEPGIFKRLCDDARTRGVAPDVGIRANPRIWKISIDGTGSSPTKTYCLSQNEARIGWGKTGDLRLPLESNDYYQALGTGDKGTLRYFSEGISVGDILLCIHSAEQINAVGVVTGEYRYESAVPSDVISDYQHVRSVRWLCKDIKLPILPLNDNKSFTLKTVYQMDRFTWGDLLAYLEKNNIPTTLPAATSGSAKPHVLIIDEINRGNISRIFGELITLIEPSKREGADEALSLDLPYSKRPFSVPYNVYLIGTMNTADRSLAGLDIALRRRFTFMEMPPQPELLDKITVGDDLNIGSLLRTMNDRIEVLLDRDHCLGHAYFLPLEKDNTLERLAFIFRQQILPLLQEYFFEDWERIAWILNDQGKQAEHQFIQLSRIDIDKLFGDKADILKNVRRWQINETAFNNIESYRSILGAGA